MSLTLKSNEGIRFLFILIGEPIRCFAEMCLC